MLIAALATFVTTAVLTPALTAWARRRQFLDIPNHRSSHVVATPRLGGVAIVVAVLAGVGVLDMAGSGLAAPGWMVLGGAVALGVLGLLDDFKGLPAIVRLLVHLIVAVVVVNRVGSLPWPAVPSSSPLAFVLTVFWCVAVTNAYNFMDGIDGIAGGQAVVAGAGWMIVGLALGSADASVIGCLLAASGGAFLLYNWHPARVFMGDAGSGFLGFLFAALPLLVNGHGELPLMVAALLLWVFLADTGTTLIRRGLRGENVLKAHRSHVYQRLVQAGRSHAQVSLLYTGLAALGAVAAIWMTAHR